MINAQRNLVAPTPAPSPAPTAEAEEPLVEPAVAARPDAAPGFLAAALLPALRKAGSRARRSPAVLGVGLALLVALGSYAGAWFLPYACALAIGAVTRVRAVHARRAVLVSVLAALGGWGAPLVVRALGGEPVAATARTVAALAGLPASAALIVAVTLLLALLQALLGTWLGRSVTAALQGLRARTD